MSTTIEWKETANGVWEAELGQGGTELLSHSGVGPARESLAKLPACNFPELDISAEVRKDFIILKMPLTEAEGIYGCGLKYKRFKLEHVILNQKCDHYAGRDDGRTHAAVPFHVSSSGYGLLLDTPAPITYYIGTAHRRDEKNPPVPCDRNTDPDWQAFNSPEYIEIAVRSSGLRVVMFAGDSVKQTVQRYNLFCGGGCLPPKWGLGFWWRPLLTEKAEKVEELVREFEQRDFPLSVVGLEPGWQSNSYPCTYEWDNDRYPDPAGFCSRLLEKDIKLNLWENPYLLPDSPLGRKLEALSGTHNVWCGITPDYTMPEVQKIVADHHTEKHIDIGVSGYKLDEADGHDTWLWPDHAEFPSGISGVEMRQLYGLCLQRIMFDIYRKKNLRTCGLTRASNSGANSFPFVIYNDNYDYEQYVTALCDCGFSGVLWTPELRTGDNAADWLRRFQLSALTPMMMLNGWASNTVPWEFAEVEDAVRETIKLRESLKAYLYSAFARYHFEGLPPFRAMTMDFGEFYKVTEKGELDGTDNPYAIAGSKEITNQFMVGDSLMCIAAKPGKDTCQIILPACDWFDFYTGDKVGNGEIITRELSERDRLPLLVKDGGIIPVLCDGGIKVRVFGSAPGEFMLYDDDGETFDFEQGKYNLTRLSTDRKIETVCDNFPSSFGAIEFE